jgi:hypothetical protein
MIDAQGRKVEKRGGYRRCDVCARSTEPGWIMFRSGDWLQCPQCGDSSKPGYIHVEVTSLTPTRSIILPPHMRGLRLVVPERMGVQK